MSYPTPSELHAAMRRQNVDELVIQAGAVLTFYLYAFGNDCPIYVSASWTDALRWLGLSNPPPDSTFNVERSTLNVERATSPNPS